MIEKAVNIEAKASLQPPSETKKIDSKYPKRYKPLVKKDKDDVYWDQHDKASNRNKKKTKSHNLSSSTNQTQTQAFNSKNYQREKQRGPATAVNAIKIAKKDKNKTKDLSHIKCYTYKQKDYYSNKCPDKPKN